jgi:hypothetical protein
MEYLKGKLNTITFKNPLTAKTLSTYIDKVTDLNKDNDEGKNTNNENEQIDK